DPVGAAARTRSRARVRGGLPARGGQRATNEPLGPQHAAVGGVRTGTRAGTRLPARPGLAPGALVPRLRGRRPGLELARAHRLLPLAAVPAAAGAGGRRRD